MLDAESQTQWSCVGKRAKAFVKSLLVLDEKKRPAAKQALQDPWFTNRTCAPVFEELYARAVKGWTKKPHKRDIVTEIDTSDIVVDPVFDEQESSSPVKSGYFLRKPMSPEIPETSPSPHPSQVHENYDDEDEDATTSEFERFRMNSFELPWPSPRRRVQLYPSMEL